MVVLIPLYPHLCWIIWVSCGWETLIVAPTGSRVGNMDTTVAPTLPPNHQKSAKMTMFHVKISGCVPAMDSSRWIHSVLRVKNQVLSMSPFDPSSALN